MLFEGDGFTRLRSIKKIIVRAVYTQCVSAFEVRPYDIVDTHTHIYTHAHTQTHTLFEFDTPKFTREVQKVWLTDRTETYVVVTNV